MTKAAAAAAAATATGDGMTKERQNDIVKINQRQNQQTERFVCAKFQ